MGNVELGKMIKALRQHRSFLTINGLRPWTQEKLAEEIMLSSQITNDMQTLSIKQIADLEQGRVSNIKPDVHIEPIARAFKLSEPEKAELYYVAGLAAPIVKRQRNNTIFVSLLKKISYPATVRTPLWDFVAFNTYNKVLWGYTDYHLMKLHNHQVRPNLLHVLFHPEFLSRNYSSSYAEWREHRLRDLHAFKISSFRYISSPEYNVIIDNLMQYTEFARLWKLSLSEVKVDDTLIVQPIIRVTHPIYGVINFMSLRLPREYHGQEVSISVYVPTEDSKKNYEMLAATISENEVYVF